MSLALHCLIKGKNTNRKTGLLPVFFVEDVVILTADVISLCIKQFRCYWKSIHSKIQMRSYAKSF